MEYKESNIIKNKNDAIKELEAFLNKCILQQDKKLQKKANLISYWIKDYTKYIEQEDSFNSKFLKQYSRGDVIKANLGFNIGSEEGGLHYCVVLDKKNTRSFSTLTVIPLSSKKDNKKIPNTCVDLGKELCQNTLNKAQTVMDSINKEIYEEYEQKLAEYSKSNHFSSSLIFSDEDVNKYHKEILKFKRVYKIVEEVKKMKIGTIALVNQITTISKQRIYDPKNDFDILSGIKISEEKMNLIDEKIKRLFIN